MKINQYLVNFGSNIYPCSNLVNVTFGAEQFQHNCSFQSIVIAFHPNLASLDASFLERKSQIDFEKAQMHLCIHNHTLTALSTSVDWILAYGT